MPLRACSACAGDYEDPDRTSWPSDDAGEGDDDPGEGEAEAAAEEFPAEK